jgi:hypothetical protein
MKKPIDPFAAVVDEIGDLEAELAPWKQKTARLEALRKSLRDHYASEPADATFEVHGTRFLTLVGPRAAQRLVNCASLFKLIGQKRFLAICAVTLKALEEACKLDVVLACVETSDTGPRTMKTFAKASAKAA